MEDEKLGCPECDCEDYESQNRQRVKEPSHQIIEVETRECKNCHKVYRIANNGVIEYYYS